MNSLQDVMKMVQESDELKAQFLAAVQEGQDKTVAFLQAQGCVLTKEELMNELNKVTEDRELTPAEIEAVAGGSKSGFTDFWNDFLEISNEDDF